MCRNDLRERVRGFVQAGDQRLMDSGNVDVLVVNAHSQGTVLCWDVLCRLPLFSWGAQRSRAEMMRGFVTARQPDRKYVDLFDWGGQVRADGGAVGPVASRGRTAGIAAIRWPIRSTAR